MKIRSRLIELNKTMKYDLIPELKNRRIFATASEVSLALSGKLRTPKAVEICRTSREILDEWESEKRRKAPRRTRSSWKMNK